jgi:hypothetical protein
MRFEVLTAVKTSMLVFWVVLLCGLVGRDQRSGKTYCLHLQHCRVEVSLEDGGSMFLRNVCIYLQIHTALQPRIPTTPCPKYEPPDGT